MPASSSTSSAQTERDPVRRAGADPHAVVEHERGEEDSLVEGCDPHLDKPVLETLEDIAEQVVRQGTCGYDALLCEGDRGGLGGPDPDGQETLALGLAQEHDRLIGGHLDPDPHDVHLAHATSLGLLRPTATRCREGHRRSSRASPALTRAE